MPAHHTLPPVHRAFALLLLAAACKSDITVTDVAVSITVTPAEDTVALGITAAPFRAAAVNFQGDTIDDPVRWSIIQPAVATIDTTTGAVTGVSTGQTRVIARTGSLADTATLVVLGPITLGLTLDTVLLAPGDTFTIPYTALNSAGGPVGVTFSGADAAIATVSASGFAQAVAPGRTSFVVMADTVARMGVIEVLAVDDTTDGNLLMVLRGAIGREVRLPARWFQYAVLGGGSLLNIAARNNVDNERLLGVFRDSLAGPGTRTIGSFPEGPAGVAVCDPPNGWLVYQDRRTTTRDGSSLSGIVEVQRVEPIPGGYRISATIKASLTFPGVGTAQLYGRFVGPLIPLASCPG